MMRLIETKVKKIEIFDATEPVYDLQIQGNHNFFASNILIHNCIVVDECLHPDSLITLVDGSQQTIKQIVEEKKVTEILSYDEISKKIVPAKILDYKIIKLEKQMVEVEFLNGSILKCTEDHKFFTKRGWRAAKDLTSKDVVAEPRTCQKCNTEFLSFLKNQKFCCTQHRLDFYNTYKNYETTCQVCLKSFKTHSQNKKFCSKECRNTFICKYCNKKFISYRAEHAYCSRYCYAKSRQKVRNKCLQCATTVKSLKSQFCIKHRKKSLSRSCSICKSLLKCYQKKYCSLSCTGIASVERMRLNNPMKNAATKQKMTDSMRKFWSSHPEKLQERLKNYKNTPLYKKGLLTSQETLINNWNLDGLIYSGDGTKWVTFKTGKHKNPDFYVRNSNKVIEVGDFEFWHTKEEADITIKNYANIGLNCLYLDAKEVSNNPNKIKEQLREFICA